MARWLWEGEFSACAGDAPAFERIPKSSSGLEDLLLHEILLSGWGMPIGWCFPKFLFDKNFADGQ